MVRVIVHGILPKLDKKEQEGMMSIKGLLGVLAKLLALAGLIIVFSIALIPRLGSAGGIGVGPTEMKITNAVRGTVYQDTIFVQFVGSENQRLQVSVSGDIVDWTKFYESARPSTPIQEVTARPGEWTYLTVKFSIPVDTQLSTATGDLWVSAAPPVGNIGNMIVGLQAKVEVTIGISGIAKIVTGKVTEVNLGDTEVGQPVNLTVGVANTGNASARPEIAVKIISGSKTIADFAKSDVTVEVGKQQAINLAWDSSGQKEGNYSAEVKVSLGDKVLDTKKISFRLLPTGSSGVSVAGTGQLVSMGLDGPASVGVNKIQGVVNNIGPADFRAKFIGEVYRDGKLIDTIQSDEVLIPSWNMDKLNMYLKVEAPGKYEIKGYVNYGGNKSGPKEFVFTVAGAGVQTDLPVNWLLVIIGGGGTAAVVGAIMVIKRRRRSILRNE